MDTILTAGDGGNERAWRDEGDWRDEREWRGERDCKDELKKARKALAEARRREEELEGVVREGERAMGELDEWIGRKVGTMSSVVAVLREEWLTRAVMSLDEGTRKRARMADGSCAHPMMMMMEIERGERGDDAEAVGRGERGGGEEEGVRDEAEEEGVRDEAEEEGVRDEAEEEGVRDEAEEEGVRDEAEEEVVRDEAEEEGVRDEAEEEGVRDEAEEEGVRDEAEETTKAMDETMGDGLEVSGNETCRQGFEGRAGFTQVEGASDEAEENHDNEAEGEEGRVTGSADHVAMQEAEQGADQGAKQGGGQEAEQGGGQEAEQGTGQGAVQGLGQGAEQGTGQGAKQGGGQEAEQGTGQGAKQGGGQEAEQGTGQEAEQGVRQEAEQGVRHGAQQGLWEERAADSNRQSVRQPVARERGVKEEVLDDLPILQCREQRSGASGFGRSGASNAEVRARLQGRINAILQFRPHRQGRVTREIDWVVSQLSSQDPTATELTLCNLSLALYLHLTPLCYAHCLPSITTLDLRRVNPVSPLAMRHLLRLPSLTALHFHETSIHADALPLLQCIPRLHRLVVACFDPFDLLPNVPPKRHGSRSPLCDTISNLQPFQPFQCLRELHVSRVTDSILQQVGVLTSLEALSCTCSKGVSAKGWVHLRGLVKLKRLLLAPTIITRHPGSNDHHFGNPFHGQRFGPKLVGPKLDFSRSRLPEVIRTFQKPPKKGAACASEDFGNRIDGSIWEVVGGLAGLQHLEVHAAEPSTAALRSLSNLRWLESLSNLRWLESLHIADTALHDADLVFLTRLPLLTHLSLPACTFAADRAVRSVIQGMAQLKALDLSGAAISHGAAVHLRVLERLERLKLQQCSGMSKVFVKHLSRIPSLRQLDLGCNSMQHAWLLPILKGKKVARLGVGGCGFVERTVRGIQRAWIEIDSH
ncbi:unnamed protein product [Closterium sp. Naga37s-1]|nr:unnamed protein product [Closterium sp. Naga37s-1]